MTEEENPPNDRVVGREYGVAGKTQLDEIKAVRTAHALANNHYYPPGATEPIVIEE